MIILAVDTASTSCSVSVVDGTSVLSEYMVNHKDTHSRFVMEMIHTMLAACRLRASDLDGIAVTTGPGSFTGLRIGLSTVKGLALAIDKPVVGVNSLEVLARQVGGPGSYPLVCPMMDARRSEVYAAVYRFLDGKMTCESAPRAVRPEKALQNITEPCIFGGDGAVAYRDLITSTLPELAIVADGGDQFIRAATIGRMAVERFMARDIDDLDALKPVYLRQSDAEKNLQHAVAT